jgi:hypothetical protein
MNSGGNKSPGLGVGAFIFVHFSHVALPDAPGNLALSLSILARPASAVCAASAQPQCRLAGSPTFQLAAMGNVA